MDILDILGTKDCCTKSSSTETHLFSPQSCLTVTSSICLRRSPESSLHLADGEWIAFTRSQILICSCWRLDFALKHLFLYLFFTFGSIKSSSYCHYPQRNLRSALQSQDILGFRYIWWHWVPQFNFLSPLLKAELPPVDFSLLPADLALGANKSYRFAVATILTSQISSWAFHLLSTFLTTSAVLLKIPAVWRMANFCLQQYQSMSYPAQWTVWACCLYPFWKQYSSDELLEAHRPKPTYRLP